MLDVLGPLTDLLGKINGDQEVDLGFYRGRGKVHVNPPWKCCHSDIQSCRSKILKEYKYSIIGAWCRLDRTERRSLLQQLQTTLLSWVLVCCLANVILPKCCLGPPCISHSRGATGIALQYQP